MDKRSFRKGLIDGLPICFGYLSVAFAFGIFSVNSGLPIVAAILISATNVTSAGQLAAVPIIMSGGSLIELAVSQLVINLRYALMSISLSQKLSDRVTLPDRLCIAFMNTDEVFGVSSAQSGLLDRPYLYGLILTPYLGWTLGTVAGAVAGDVLPSIVTEALGVAIYGMFVAIVLPAVKTNRPTALCVAVAMALSCLFRFVPILSTVPSGFVIIICALAAGALMAWLAPIPVTEEVDTP